MTSLSQPLLAELDIAISERHLGSVAEEIRNNAAECYALIAIGEDDYTTVGNTRFGGDPDLPGSMEWPVSPDDSEPQYCNFIAQINFAELPPLSIERALPKKGILYLFVRYMESAGEPVILDAIYYDGDIAALSRRPTPPSDSQCDEYLVDLAPQRVRAVPSVSIASFRKQFRKYIDDNTQEIDGYDGNFRLIDLESDLRRENQIGQLLGFANAGDKREDLYRQVVLARLEKRELVYNDYWESIEDYEAYIERWQSDQDLVKMYRGMRDGVEWLMSNREMIAKAVNEWRLLFRLDSNTQMNLNINDADPLYVFIRHEDLARADFTNIAGEVTQG